MKKDSFFNKFRLFLKKWAIPIALVLAYFINRYRAKRFDRNRRVVRLFKKYPEHLSFQYRHIKADNSYLLGATDRKASMDVDPDMLKEKIGDVATPFFAGKIKAGYFDLISKKIEYKRYFYKPVSDPLKVFPHLLSEGLYYSFNNRDYWAVHRVYYDMDLDVRRYNDEYLHNWKKIFGNDVPLVFDKDSDGLCYQFTLENGQEVKIPYVILIYDDASRCIWFLKSSFFDNLYSSILKDKHYWDDPAEVYGLDDYFDFTFLKCVAFKSVSVYKEAKLRLTNYNPHINRGHFLFNNSLLPDAVFDVSPVKAGTDSKYSVNVLRDGGVKRKFNFKNYFYDGGLHSLTSQKSVELADRGFSKKEELYRQMSSRADRAREAELLGLPKSVVDVLSNSTDGIIPRREFEMLVNAKKEANKLRKGKFDIAPTDMIFTYLPFEKGRYE